MVLSQGSIPVSRRQVLSGLAAAAILAPVGGALAGISDPVARSGLAERTGVALADLRDGGLIESWRAETGQPPASVLKIMTTLYALDALGPDYRFTTRIIATGPVDDGVLKGDLVLAGDGDPLLDTDDLKRMAAALITRGVTGVSGRFLVAEGALPFTEAVDPGQPMYVGYNPAISGLNLNFNRVWVEWQPGKGGRPDFGFAAPGRDFRVRLAGIGGELGAAPPPRHRVEGTREIWTLPGREMKGRGGVWLPARRPGAYAGEVFRDLAAEFGLALPAAELVGDAPPGEVLVAHESAALDEILHGMLRYSTNITAEIVGLRASQARGLDPTDVGESAAAMTEWARARYGLTEAVFVNHSGLSALSLWSPAETVKVLAAEAGGALPRLLREQALLGPDRRPLVLPHVRVAAKSGTLFFASGLAGYIQGPDRTLAFAIYSSDADLRATIRPDAAGRPPGARGWAGRARGMQQALLRDWATEAFPPPPLRPMHRPG